jgi:hypothetical protein
MRLWTGALLILVVATGGSGELSLREHALSASRGIGTTPGEICAIWHLNPCNEDS